MHVWDDKIFFFKIQTINDYIQEKPHICVHATSPERLTEPGSQTLQVVQTWRWKSGHGAPARPWAGRASASPGVCGHCCASCAACSWPVWTIKIYHSLLHTSQQIKLMTGSTAYYIYSAEVAQQTERYHKLFLNHKNISSNAGEN